MIKKDIIVIGGGVAGLTLAANLSPHASVVVLEAEEVTGYHASGRSAALYEPGYGAAPIQALTDASWQWYEASGLLSPRGLLLLSTKAEDPAFDADLLAMDLTEISLSKAQEIVPILNSASVRRAAFGHKAWDIDTDLLMQNAVKQIRANGGQIVLRAPVTAISREDDAWVVTAGASSYRAAKLVNAAGAWVGRIAQMAGVAGPDFQPMRRSMARIPGPEGMRVEGWPMLFGPADSWYAKPDAGALIVSPSDADPVEPHDAWADDMVLAEGLARYEEVVTPPVTRLLASWAGLRTFAPDKVPLIGPDPRATGFYWQAGLGGYGFQTAPAASRLGADLILGHAPDLDADLVAQVSPARFALTQS